jgi:coenzyme F420-reducing hydrogenase gamma subunit
MSKPRVGIFGLTSCAGDQLVILNCEDELLKIANRIDIKDWVMAQSKNDETCELDVSLVEGVVATERDIEKLKNIRERSKLVIGIGTCAVFGGVAAMKNQIPREVMKEEVYGANIDFLDSVKAQPISSFIKVDYRLPGCPIEKPQLLETISSLCIGDIPEILNIPVCMECKIKENICLVVEKGFVCCGALTVAGCGARCPSHNVPCGGCHGPIEETHYDANITMFKESGISRIEIERKMAMFATPGWMTEKLMEEINHEA